MTLMATFTVVPIYRLPFTVVEPPTRPPVASKLKMGLYCIKAQCKLLTKDGNKIADFVGYDSDLGITKSVEQACEWRRSGVKVEKCTKAELSFVDRAKHQPCQGEIYFVHEKGSVQKIV